MSLNPHKFKELKTQETKLAAKLNTANDDLRTAKNSVASINHKLKGIREQLANGSDGVVVSEHAMLRYIEREKGIDLKLIKAEILTDTVKEQIKVIGSGKIPLCNLNLIVKNKIIVSAVPVNKKGRKKMFNEKDQKDIKESYRDSTMNVAQIARLYRASPGTIDRIIEGKY